MTDVEAVEIVGMLVAMYPAPGWPKERVKLYAAVIVDLDRDLAREGVLEIFRTRTEDRAPMPAELRRLVAAKQAAAVASPYLEPDEAWGFVQRHFTRTGHAREFPSDHPLVAEVVRSMGWRDLCLSENVEASRAHFLQLYRGRVERARRDDAATPGAVPHAAMGERPSVVHRDPPKIEQRATAADARALVASVSESIGRRPLPAPPKPEIVLTAEIDDAAEIARREQRRRDLLAQLEVRP